MMQQLTAVLQARDDYALAEWQEVERKAADVEHLGSPFELVVWGAEFAAPERGEYRVCLVDAAGRVVVRTWSIHASPGQTVGISELKRWNVAG